MRITRLQRLAMLFVLTAAACHSTPTAADDSPARHWPPRVIFNSDGASTTLYRFPVPITDEQCSQTVAQLNGTPVDVFSMSIGTGGSVFWDSRHGHIYGEGVKNWTIQPGAEKLLAALRKNMSNESSLRARGIDLTRLRLEKAHGQDMLFLASIRMNDSHEDDEGRFWFGRDDFKIGRPELLLGSPSPKWNAATRDCNFSWGYNYARSEVRERRRKLVEEICTRYDVDGVELDFMRSPVYFKKGEIFKNIPNMTEMIAGIRQTMDRLADAKGKKLHLVVRVPPRIGTALELGLDTETWIKDRLVDVVVPMSAGYLDSEAEIEGFVKAADGTGTLIYGGIEPATRSRGPGSPFDLCRAVAFSAYAEGAQGIYLFNYDAHNHNRRGVYNEEERRFLHAIESADRLRWMDKTYFVTPQMGSGTGGDPLRQLPRRLALIGRGAGAAHDVTFKFYDDIESARADGRLKSVRLRMKIVNIGSDWNRLRVNLNSKRLPNDRLVRKGGFITFDDPPLVRGLNSLLVLLEGSENPASPDSWPELQLVEAAVHYQDDR